MTKRVDHVGKLLQHKSRSDGLVTNGNEDLCTKDSGMSWYSAHLI